MMVQTVQHKHITTEEVCKISLCSELAQSVDILACNNCIFIHVHSSALTIPYNTHATRYLVYSTYLLILHALILFIIRLPTYSVVISDQEWLMLLGV